MRPKGGAHDFEDWLDRELQRTLGSVRGPSRQPSRAVYAAAPSGGALMAIKAKVVAALTTRAAAGVAAAALALGGGVVAASAASGGTHPWGQQVSEWVEHCKQEVQADSSGAPRNVGQCVSAFARQNGPAHRAEHSPEPKESPSATPDHGLGTDRDQHGQPSSLPTAQSHGQAGRPHDQSGQAHGSQSSGHGQPRPSPTVHT
jgi:hypothetical protein